MVTLPEKAHTLFDGTNFAVLSTLQPDGMPHATVVWFKREGDDLLFALPATRRKTANLRRDPRASATVFDTADPYASILVQGTVTLEEDPDGVLIEELSRAYLGGPYPGFAGPDPTWLTARLTATAVHTSWPSS